MDTQLNLILNYGFFLSYNHTLQYTKNILWAYVNAEFPLKYTPE